jgi:hypothetical protein
MRARGWLRATLRLTSRENGKLKVAEKGALRFEIA